MSTIRAAMTHRLLGETSGPLAGIYVVTHRASGLRYVGQSRDIARRWSEHRKGRGDSRRLTNAIRKHGPNAFAFEIVELCAPEELNDREAFYVWAFDCLSPKGYNLTTGGGQAQTFTPEVRAKMSESLRTSPSFRRRWADPEFRARLSASLRNSESLKAAQARIHADPHYQERNREHLARLNADPAILEGRRLHLARLNADPEFRAKVSESVRATTSRRWADPETRAAMTRKIAESNRRKAQDPEYLAKIATSNRSRRHTEEHVLIHTTTGAVERGLRWELVERLGLHQGNFSSLIHGRYKTVQGYRLARPEEIK